MCSRQQVFQFLLIRFTGRSVIKIPCIFSGIICLINQFIICILYGFRFRLRFFRRLLCRLFYRLRRRKHISQSYQIGTDITGLLRTIRSCKRNIIPGFVAACCLSAYDHLRIFRQSFHNAFACGSAASDLGIRHLYRSILGIHRCLRRHFRSRRSSRRRGQCCRTICRSG